MSHDPRSGRYVHVAKATGSPKAPKLLVVSIFSDPQKFLNILLFSQPLYHT